MKTATKILATAVVLLFATSAWAQISTTRHNFSSQGWTNEICKPCHTPHNADTTVNNAPLWNHTVATGPWTPYDNTTATQDSAVGTINGVSQLCLSCHDGSVAVDSFGGGPATPSVFIGSFDAGGTRTPGYADLTQDLSNDHPVGITYDPALATLDGELVSPASGTEVVAGIPLFNSRLECATCHDPHGTGNPSLLRVDNTGSALCLTCHIK